MHMQPHTTRNEPDREVPPEGKGQGMGGWQLSVCGGLENDVWIF